MNKRILYLTFKLLNFKVSRIAYLFIALVLGLMVNVNANEIKVKQLKINTNNEAYKKFGTDIRGNIEGMDYVNRFFGYAEDNNLKGLIEVFNFDNTGLYEGRVNQWFRRLTLKEGSKVGCNESNTSIFFKSIDLNTHVACLSIREINKDQLSSPNFNKNKRINFSSRKPTIEKFIKKKQLSVPDRMIRAEHYFYKAGQVTWIFYSTSINLNSENEVNEFINQTFQNHKNFGEQLRISKKTQMALKGSKIDKKNLVVEKKEPNQTLELVSDTEKLFFSTSDSISNSKKYYAKTREEALKMCQKIHHTAPQKCIVVATQKLSTGNEDFFIATNPNDPEIRKYKAKTKEEALEMCRKEFSNRTGLGHCVIIKTNQKQTSGVFIVKNKKFPKAGPWENSDKQTAIEMCWDKTPGHGWLGFVRKKDGSWEKNKKNCYVSFDPTKNEIDETKIVKKENLKKENLKKKKADKKNIEDKKKKIAQKKAKAEERKRIADKKIEEEKIRIAQKKAEAEERERLAKIKIEEEKKRISQNNAEEEAKNQELISSNKEKSTSKSRKKNKSNSKNFLEALAKKEVIEGSRKKIIRYECQQSWDLTTEDYRPLLDIYELDLRDRTLKGTHRYITDKEYTDERVYPILATDKDRVLVQYDSPNGNFSTKFFFNYGTDQSIVAADNSYKTKSKCVNRDYFVDIKIAKKNVAKVDTSKNDLKALELAKKEAILAQKEIEKIEKEQKQLLANQNKILKDQKQKTKTTKVAKLKVYDDPKKFTTSLSSSISKSQFKKYNATSTVSYLFFESSENYLISIELLYRAYDLNTDADKIRSHIAYMKESKSSEKNRLSSTRQIVQTQSIVISNNIEDQSLELSEQGKVYYAQALPYALNAAISTYNLYHVASNTISNVGDSGDVVFGILNNLNNVIGIAQILPQIPSYSKNMFKTTKLIISGAKVRKIKDSTNVNKALDELNLET